MKSFFELSLNLGIRFLLSLRYRVTIKGKKELASQKKLKPGGILFLANHPAEIDPLILTNYLWSPFKPRPVAIEYLFRQPVVGFLLNFVCALPIPNFDTGSNSYKRKKMEKTYANVLSALERSQNILVYPAGSLKSGPEEVIGGASGVHTLLQAKPDANIVLIRTTGLWGSSFSRAPTGFTPNLFPAFLNGFKVLLKNFIFFCKVLTGKAIS